MDWIFITNDPIKASIAEAAGVGRIMVDLELLDKERRQGHLDTAISRHSLDDVRRIRGVLTKSSLMVRVNPVHEGSAAEVEQCVQQGADIIMLPMFTNRSEVCRFIDMVQGRARVCLLLETPQALVRADEILETGGIDEVHIGLNDLHIGLGLTFMFELLAHGVVERLAQQVLSRGIKFGFGGVARLEQGELSPRLILSEHVRLGSTQVILSRAFHRQFDADPGASEARFRQDVNGLRGCYDALKAATPEELQRNADETKLAIRMMVADIQQRRLGAIHA